MGYKAVYPDEAIQAHLAFLARRRACGPARNTASPPTTSGTSSSATSNAARSPLGTCGRAFGTPCIHEHACIRCSMLWPDPAQRDRLVEIRDNLTARIAEAQREGWLGEVEGLKISLAGANDKLAQIDRRTPRPAAVDLGMPALTPDLDRPATHRSAAEDQVQRMRREAMTCGAWPVRTCERSSAKVTSRTQCRAFSICQCPRIHAASSAGLAWCGARSVMA